MRNPEANKKLGQHFLKDQSVISRITEDFTDAATSIIEVGPGPAVLTKFLAAHNKPIFVVEKDLRMREYLETCLEPSQIHFDDALEVDLNQLMDEHQFEEPTWLVSNLPYNVSVPLLLKFLKTPRIRYMSLMFQKEVGDKVLPSEKKNPMSSLMALGQTYFKVKRLCLVPPGAFQPPPQVDSIVLSFERIESPVIPLEDFKGFEEFLRKLFQFKRKQLVKNLKSYRPVEKIHAALKNQNISPTVRAEALNLEQVQVLYRDLQ